MVADEDRLCPAVVGRQVCKPVRQHRRDCSRPGRRGRVERGAEADERRRDVDFQGGHRPGGVRHRLRHGCARADEQREDEDAPGAGFTCDALQPIGQDLCGSPLEVSGGNAIREPGRHGLHPHAAAARPSRLSGLGLHSCGEAAQGERGLRLQRPVVDERHTQLLTPGAATQGPRQATPPGPNPSDRAEDDAHGPKAPQALLLGQGSRQASLVGRIAQLSHEAKELAVDHLPALLVEGPLHGGDVCGLEWQSRGH
mmetsp:Transcript_74/g.176  ORF Transcript_74/g.176 Transcript_74/m.176 type:complete len:255 (+) Transcript_74:485-1249(+)